MKTSVLLVLIIGLLLAIGISIAIRTLLHGRRFVLHESGTRHVLKVNPQKEGQSDEIASVASEQIEEMVKSKLAEYADLIDMHFDFRTSADGMLEIVFGERTYQNVGQIPDERVRQAITEAVAEFNRE